MGLYNLIISSPDQGPCDTELSHYCDNNVLQVVHTIIIVLTTSIGLQYTEPSGTIRDKKDLWVQNQFLKKKNCPINLKVAKYCGSANGGRYTPYLKDN